MIGNVEVVNNVDYVASSKKILFHVTRDNHAFELYFDIAAEKSDLIRSWNDNPEEDVLCKINFIWKDDFRQIAKYLNNDQYLIIEDNFLDILNCGMCLQIRSLADFYIRHLQNSMSLENLCTRVSKSFELSNWTFIRICLDFIKENEILVLNESTIFDIGYYNVTNLLKCNIFMGNEIPLFRAMVLWIKWQLARATPAGDAYLPIRDNYFCAYLKAIPFNRMSARDFLMCVEEEPTVLTYWRFDGTNAVPTWTTE